PPAAHLPRRLLDWARRLVEQNPAHHTHPVRCSVARVWHHSGAVTFPSGDQFAKTVDRVVNAGTDVELRYGGLGRLALVALHHPSLSRRQSDSLPRHSA